MHWPIGQHQAVSTEVVVVRPTPEVAAVCPELFPVGLLLANTPISPTPDKAPVQIGRGFENLPILLEIARAVAVGTSLLEHEHRPPIPARLVIGNQIVGSGVPRGDEVAECAIRRRVADRKFGVMCLRPAPGGFQIATDARLVPHREGDDGGMVLVAFDRATEAIHMRAHVVLAV